MIVNKQTPTPPTTTSLPPPFTSIAKGGDEGSHNSMSQQTITHGSPKTYKYRDYGGLTEEELIAMENGEGGGSASESYSPANSPPSSGNSPFTTSPPPTRGSLDALSLRGQKFPIKLYAILKQREFNDIISWMPHGRSWKILKPQLFESTVMPLFFEYSNYHSFNRLINAWSFRRISAGGPDRGSYYHELFLRGKPRLHKFMRRLPKTHKKVPMKRSDEPDFYKFDQFHPLPPLEDGDDPATQATLPMAIMTKPRPPSIVTTAPSTTFVPSSAFMDPRRPPVSTSSSTATVAAAVPDYDADDDMDDNEYDASMDPLMVGMTGMIKMRDSMGLGDDEDEADAIMMNSDMATSPQTIHPHSSNPEQRYTPHKKVADVGTVPTTAPTPTTNRLQACKRSSTLSSFVPDHGDIPASCAALGLPPEQLVLRPKQQSPFHRSSMSAFATSPAATASSMAPGNHTTLATRPILATPHQQERQQLLQRRPATAPPRLQQRQGICKFFWFQSTEC